MQAIMGGQSDMALALIANNADLQLRSPTGNTALSFAAYRGDARVLQALIDHNADVNVANHEGCTPLMLASLVGSIECVRMLIAAGADIGSTFTTTFGQRFTASDIARERGHELVLEELKLAGLAWEEREDLVFIFDMDSDDQ